MSPSDIRLHPEPTLKQRKRQAPKGRGLDPQALQEVQGLLGNASRSSDELIEHLHRLQDAFGQLSSKHLAALAHEMRISQAQVYEVASFYHHFDIVKEGQTSPATLTVRVCDGLSCEMAGAKNLLTTLPSLLGQAIRVIPVPCIGRCEQAPAAMVGQHAIPSATPSKIKSCVDSQNTQAEPTHHIDYSQYKAAGGYALLSACMNGQRDVESVIHEVESSGLRGLGGAGFGAGRKWRILKTQKQNQSRTFSSKDQLPSSFWVHRHSNSGPLERKKIEVFKLGTFKYPFCPLIS
jgi:formate dehydrogenase